MGKRIAIGFTLTLFILLSAALIVACNKPQEETTAPEAGAPEAGALDGKSLAQTRCSGCHGYDTVETAKKTSDEWKTTVERMVAKGATLNQAEQEAVIAYLTDTYPK